MTHADPYAEFALVYDDWQYLYPQPFSLSLRPRMVRILEEFPIPGRIYADLGCGTGTFAAWWKTRFPDWRVFGVDRSPAMIAQARRTASRGAQKHALLEWGLSARSLRAASFDEMMAAAEAMQAGTEPESLPAGADAGPATDGSETSKSGVEFLVQPFDGLDLPTPVALASCLFDGINHLTRTAELEAAFRSVYDALLPGGVFVFDLVHEDVFAEAFDGAVIRKGPGLVVAADSIRYHRGEILFGKTTFSVFREEGSGWQRYEAEISERCWTRKEIRGALDDAGLDLLRQDDIDPAVETEFRLPRTFWVCRRPPGETVR